MIKPGRFTKLKPIRRAVLANCPSYIPVTDDYTRNPSLLWPAKCAEKTSSVVNRQPYPHPIDCAQPPLPDTRVVVLRASRSLYDGRDQVNARPPVAYFTP
jgi:hypothetical protein